MDIVAYALSRKFTEESLIGLGALKGANCIIKSIVPVLDVDGNEIANEVTFEWTATDGTKETKMITVKNGLDGESTIVEIEQATLSDTWTLQHNLDTDWHNLSITCLTDTNDIVVGDIDVDNTTKNLVMIKFTEPTMGKAIIKK